MLERFLGEFKDNTASPEKLQKDIATKVDNLLKDVEDEKGTHRKVKGFAIPNDLVDEWKSMPNLEPHKTYGRRSSRLVVGSKEKDGVTLKAATLILEQGEMEADHYYHLRVSGGAPLLFTHIEQPGKYARKALITKGVHDPTWDTWKAFNKFLNHALNSSTK